MKISKTLFVSCVASIFLLASCKKQSTSPGSDLAINSISPVSGTSNINDTLTGTGFSASISDDSVFFNGKSATILSAGTKQLIVSVPAGASTGKVSVSVKGQTATGPVFTFTTDTSGASDSVYIVSTLAGSGQSGFVNGTGAAASFAVPNSMVLDASGNLYVNDYGNNVIRKVTPAGVVTTFAGSGQAGNNDGVGIAASFNGPYSVAIDPGGNIYVAEWANNDIRKISPSGAVSTFAGALSYGYTDATGTAARFYHPASIACDNLGNLYVFDDYNNHIRKITSGGLVSTFVGTGTAGKADGTGTSAQVGNVSGMSTDAANNVYMAESLYNTIRKINPAGVVTTIAGRGDSDNLFDADGVGTQASFAGPNDVASDKFGNLFVVDNAVGGATVRKITPAGVVTTIAGIPNTQGSTDGPGHQATFGGPAGIVVAPSGVIYVCDWSNDNIRVLTPQR
jgi:hypothetical protein